MEAKQSHTVGAWFESHSHVYLIREFLILIPCCLFLVLAILTDIADQDVICGPDEDGERREHERIRNQLRGFMCIHTLFIGKFIFKTVDYYKRRNKHAPMAIFKCCQCVLDDCQCCYGATVLITCSYHFYHPNVGC